MPIKVQKNLPAIKILEGENVFVMPEDRALTQDIRPLKIVILNLMPTKVVTETQLLRLLGNSPLQVDIELLQMATHRSKNTSRRHLTTFYKTFDEIKNQRFDGMIITGAPVEQLDFEEVDYWEELCEIMDWSKKNVYSVLHICWGAQAGLYHRYGVRKFEFKEKLSGVFEHKILNPVHPLLRGFDDNFKLPHSRYTGVVEEDMKSSQRATRRACRLSARRTAEPSMCSDTPSMTAKPSLTSISAILTRDLISRFPRIISPTTTPPKNPEWCGEVTRACCSRTGLTIMSISRRRTTSRI